jgi:hypothetical protein
MELNKNQNDSNDLLNNDYFISLIELAIENDDEIGVIIKNLILKNKNERSVILTKIIDDLEKNNVNPELITALKFLFHDKIIIKIKELLNK